MTIAARTPLPYFATKILVLVIDTCDDSKISEDMLFYACSACFLRRLGAGRQRVREGWLQQLPMELRGSAKLISISLGVCGLITLSEDAALAALSKNRGTKLVHLRDAAAALLG